jgi:hypothetical protein
VGLSRLNIFTPIRWIWYDLDTNNYRSVSILPLCLPREGEATMTETRIDPLAWCENYREVHSFGEWLYKHGRLNAPEDILLYFGKPWAWQAYRPIYEAEQDIPL